MKNSELLKTCRGNLKRYLILKELKRKQEYKALPQGLSFKKDNVQTSTQTQSRMEQIAIDMIIIDDKIEQQLFKITEQISRAGEIISEIDGDKQIILRLYYLTLKTELAGGSWRKQRQYTFSDIAEILGYSESHIKRLNREALREID